MTRTCEIDSCGGDAIGTMTGVAVCERCRVEWVSARPWGAVFFGGRWHGVIGATYPADVVEAYPGLPVIRAGSLAEEVR